MSCSFSSFSYGAARSIDETVVWIFSVLCDTMLSDTRLCKGGREEGRVEYAEREAERA